MKDWTGDSNSVYKTLGASNHTDEEREINDFYATDPVAIDILINEGNVVFDYSIWECACGQGHLSERLKQFGYKVCSSDLVNRGYGDAPIDFLLTDRMPEDTGIILTNPPYKASIQFIEHSMELLPENGRCFMFLKLQFLEGKARKELFKKYPLKTLYVSSSRILCAKNGDFEHGKLNGGSAVAYGWYEFQKGYKGEAVIRWIN